MSRNLRETAQQLQQTKDELENKEQEIQKLREALEQKEVLPGREVFAEDVWFSREELDEYDGEEIGMIMNGWFIILKKSRAYRLPR